MKLLVLKGASRNDVLTQMGERLAAAFEARGVETVAPYVDGNNLRPVIEQALAGGDIEGVVSFASFGVELKGADGRSLYDGLKYGFTGWNVDHPTYHFDRIVAPVTRRLTVCAQPAHLDVFDMAGARTRKLPMLPGVEVEAAGKPWRERQTPVLVAMSWIGAPDRWWDQAGAGTPVHRLMEAMLERLTADPEADVMRAYQGAARSIGFDLPLNKDIADLIANLFLHVRQRDRLQLVEALIGAGIPFTLCGDQWDRVMNPHPLVTHLPPRDFHGLKALYDDCRVVVNLNAGNGGSERALQAMAAGAAVVSDWGPLLEAEFGDAVGVYNRADPARTIRVIGEVLESRGETMAEAGRAAVEARHRWSNKAEVIEATLREAWVEHA